MNNKVSLATSLNKFFYLTLLTTLIWCSIVFMLSQHLDNKVNGIVSREVPIVETSLQIAKESHKLLEKVAKLQSFSDEMERRQALSQLAQQWSKLTTLVEQIAILDEQGQFQDTLKQIQHHKEDIVLLDTLTRDWLVARENRRRLTQQLTNTQTIYNQSMKQLLGELDYQIQTEIREQQKDRALSLTHLHTELVAFYYRGHQLMSLILEGNESTSISQVNQLSRDAYILYQELQKESKFKKQYQDYLNNWLQQIRPFILGPRNLFSSVRQQLKISTTTQAQLTYHTQLALQTSEQAELLEIEKRQEINLAGASLHKTSALYVYITLVVAVCFLALMAYLVRHYLIKYMLAPLLATRNAMTNIADEKIHIPLPNTQVKELDDMLQALERLKSYVIKVAEMSVRDSLTHCYNRRGFDRQLSLEIKRTHRDKLPLCLILFDIDNFKEFNDEYGHQAGDDAIIQVARAANRILKRSNDFIARYGGEEFAIILPNTSIADGADMAEKIRQQVLKLNITHKFSEHNAQLSISLGVAHTQTQSQQSEASLIKAADNNLYRAKNEGRNKVISSDVRDSVHRDTQPDEAD